MSDVVVKAIGVEEDVMSFVVVLEKLVRLVGRGLRNWWAIELWLVYSLKLNYACGSHGLAVWSVGTFGAVCERVQEYKRRTD